MKEFKINEKNKALWDSNFIKVEGRDDVQSCEDGGVWKKAEPLNNDPDVQEYGAVTDLLKCGYLNRDYKIFQISTEPVCFITKEPLELYDVVALINGWEQFNSFVVFLGTIEDDSKYLFKYLHSSSDSIRNYTPEV